MQTAARVWHACAVVHTSAALVRLSTDVVASVPITTHAQKGRPHNKHVDVEDEKKIFINDAKVQPS